jgi:hypothetical protein
MKRHSDLETRIVIVLGPDLSAKELDNASAWLQAHWRLLGR